MWVFEVIFKIIKIKLKIPFLSCTCHMSSAHRSDVACGYHIEPHRERTFASLQTVLLDKPGLSKMGLRGLHWWLRGKESISQGRRHRFESWVWKIPHAVEQLSPCATRRKMELWLNYRKEEFLLEMKDTSKISQLQEGYQAERISN